MNVLITVAHPSEISCENYGNVLITGVGGTVSTTNLSLALDKYRADIVINVGTCVSLNEKDLHKVIFPGTLRYSNGFSHIQECLFEGRTLLQSDMFITKAEELTDFGASLGDMESASQALLCRSKGIEFYSIKYVTDFVANTSPLHWEKALEYSRPVLSQVIRYLTKIPNVADYRKVNQDLTSILKELKTEVEPLP